MKDNGSFDTIDAFALKAPNEALENYLTLSTYLGSMPDMNDYQKARSVYCWVASNITYDIGALTTKQKTNLHPDKVIAEKKAVCEGYANLFMAMCNHIGVKAWKVDGEARAATFGFHDVHDLSHAWNAVLVEGKYLLVDCTWGAGYVSEDSFIPRFTDYYFLCPPSELVYSHIPAFNQWQLLEHPLSKQDILDLPNITGQFFAQKFEVLQYLHMEEEKVVALTLKVPRNFAIMCQLKEDKEKLKKMFSISQ